MFTNQKYYTLSATADNSKSEVPLRDGEVVQKVYLYELNANGKEVLHSNPEVDRIIFIATGTVEVTVDANDLEGTRMMIDNRILRVSGSEALEITSSQGVFTVLEVRSL